MRKLLVSAVAAATLLAGGFAATAAGAAPRDRTSAGTSVRRGMPVQQRVLALVNANRRRGGCPRLSLDRRLTSAAYRHAADMAHRRYFAHDSLDGEGAGDRVRDTGYRWSRYGENIARGAGTASQVVDGWMHSRRHRANIMDCRLRQMGVGLAFDRRHMPYWVQDFATPSR